MKTRSFEIVNLGMKMTINRDNVMFFGELVPSAPEDVAFPRAFVVFVGGERLELSTTYNTFLYAFEGTEK